MALAFSVMFLNEGSFLGQCKTRGKASVNALVSFVCVLLLLLLLVYCTFLSVNAKIEDIF